MKQPGAAMSYETLITTALEIARQRRQTLDRLREALQEGDDAEAISLARILCGLTNEQKSHRVDTSIHRRTGS